MRLAVVAIVVLAVLAARAAVTAWQRRVRAEQPDHPPVPGDLLDGERTWVVFTTPYCASCGPAADHLRRHDPRSTVRMVDATERPELAEAFSVRRTPTALLASADGTVLTRLVGADSVRHYVAAPAA